jgi:hypothetical protein
MKGEAWSEAGNDSTAPARRLMLFMPGHDPTDMDYHYGRFVYQAAKFAKLWSFDVRVSERLDDGALDGEMGPSARWRVAASGPNWQHETDYEILRWDDIVVELDERPDPVRLGRGFYALSDFFFTGTAWRYLKACVRYGMFFFFPYLITGLFAGLAWLAGWLAMLGLGYGLATPWPGIGGVLVGIGVFFALFHQPGRRWRLHQALDDWDLARNYMYGRTPTVDARLDRLGELLVQRVASRRYDEIILVGHSLGATLVLRVIGRALDLDPQLCERGTRICLLTCGATIPKLALHPSGGRVRAEAARLANLPGLAWAEYQARHDAINFHKFHPVLLRRTGFDRSYSLDGPRPLLRDANIKHMVMRENFRRHRWSPMRIHYQFMLANEKRAPYDYFMIALGPVPFAVLATDKEGAVNRFKPDGSLLSVAPFQPQPPTSAALDAA